jgi:hypothetical protein
MHAVLGSRLGVDNLKRHVDKVVVEKRLSRHAATQLVHVKGRLKPSDGGEEGLKGIGDDGWVIERGCGLEVVIEANSIRDLFAMFVETAE